MSKIENQNFNFFDILRIKKLDDYQIAVISNGRTETYTYKDKTECETDFISLKDRLKKAGRFNVKRTNK